MSDIDASLPEGVVVRNRFIRGRNVLYSEFDCGVLLVDYYLHRRDHALEYPDAIDERFRDLLAGFTLHCAARPRNEVLAWTVRFNDPLMSAFLGGDSELGAITGRVFTENIRESGSSEMYQDLKRPGRPVHRSMVDFGGDQAVDAIERFYAQSEQRPGRFFYLGGDRYGLLTAHPDFDEAWFEGLDEAVVQRLEQDETLVDIETRIFRWFCGCSHEKILEILTPIMARDPESLFGDDPSAQVNCPRCGARYIVTREALEDKLQRRGDA